MSPDFSVPMRTTRGVLRRKIRMPGFAGLYWNDNFFLSIILPLSVAQSVFNLIELGVYRDRYRLFVRLVCDCSGWP